MRPQRAMTGIREKMTVVNKICGSSTSERLMHKPGDLKRDSLTNWQPVQLPQHWCDAITVLNQHKIRQGDFATGTPQHLHQNQNICIRTRA